MSLSTGILFLLSMAASTYSSVVPRINVPAIDSLTAVLAWLIGFIMLFFVFALLLKFMPNTKHTGVMFGWRAFYNYPVRDSQDCFTYYLSNFSSYNQVYGSLAAVIILLSGYIFCVILIIGAEVTSEYSRLHDR